MNTANERALRMLEDNDGIARLQPAWVARDWLPPGRRLGLAESDYDVGERGFICERWLASTTKADNRVGPPDEGLSYLAWDGPELTLAQLVKLSPRAVLGSEYARSHSSLGRLAKIFDFEARIPYHIHPRMQHARLAGRISKDEAYYFPPGPDMGKHPESFLGVHPSLGLAANGQVFLKYLVDWDSDEILQHAPAYLQVPEEGFFVPSGVLHAPGTALTIELQEDSDAMAMFQALNAGRIISKEMLFKDVAPAIRQRYGERSLLEWVDWPANADPYFYENRRLTPMPVANSKQPGGEEHWLFYGSPKFIGKKLTVRAGQTYTSTDPGVYSLLVWQGSGVVGDKSVTAGRPGEDELLIVGDRAKAPLTVNNTGSTDLLIIKFFGPDIVTENPLAEPAIPVHSSDQD